MIKTKTTTSFLLITLICLVGCMEEKHDNIRQMLPTYEQWSRIEEGMHVDKVLEILGDPINSVDLEEYAGTRISVKLYYGSPLQKSDIWPEPPSYGVWINGRDMKVSRKETPYGDVAIVSKDGKPTIPQIAVPVQHTQFDHYPRYIDIRWFPSAGKLPITYELEVSTEIGTNKWELRKYETLECYYVDIHTGRSKGRLRIRSGNDLGASQWSDYIYFEFKR